MGTKKQTKKKKKKIRFDLSIGQVTGIVAIFLCLVLWIFLLGVWTGQTLMEPQSKERQSIEASIAHIKKNIAKLDWHTKTEP